MKTIHTLTLSVAITVTAFAQDCDDIRNSANYFNAAATGATEQESRINALTLLAENISSVVSSRTDMLTKDDGAPNRQKFSNYSKSTSLLQLKGVRYITCDRNKKSGITTLAFISRKDLEQSAVEVSARVQQYLSLMEQKEANGTDFLPEAYIAYLNTFMSPYAIEYHSDVRHITNVRGYLESYLRTFLSNITVTCPAVTENSEYPDQQLTMALSLVGVNNTRMGFVVEIQEYNAKTFLDGANGNMDVIMTPDSRKTKFNAKLSLAPPPLEADLKDISDRVGFSREVSFEANMSNIIKLDFSIHREGNDFLLSPVVEHFAVRKLEWLSGGAFLSDEQKPRIAAEGLKEITLRVNGNDNFTVTKVLPLSLTDEPRAGYVSNPTVVVLESIDNTPTTKASLEQVSSSFPDDAVVLVYSDRKGLSFNSSMSAIDKQAYNAAAHRYELLVKPVKQILTVEGEGLISKNNEIINPRPAEIFNFRTNVVTMNKGFLAINSHPSNAAVFINDIETVHRTPCILELNAGLTKLSLQERNFQSMDTVIRIEGGNTREFTVNLLPMPGVNADNAELSYLNGRHEREYYLPENPAEIEAATVLRNYQRQTLIFKRRAAVYYTTGLLFVGAGAGYHWLDRIIYDTAHGTSHASIMSTMGDAFYILGGAAIVGGIITSVKLSHHKKNWNIQPVPNPGGAGVLLTYKFK
jgi:hypothetical protein